MITRTRKFIGVLTFVVFTTIYFLIAIALAFVSLPNKSTPVQLIFYLLATGGWFFVSALIIRWAQTPGRDGVAPLN